MLRQCVDRIDDDTKIQLRSQKQLVAIGVGFRADIRRIKLPQRYGRPTGRHQNASASQRASTSRRLRPGVPHR